MRASEALKTAILETALDAIVTIDQSGHILDFNQAAEKMFGHRREEALGKEMAEVIIPPHLRERHRHGLARAVATGQDTIVGQRVEITAIRKSGEEFPVELAITRIRVNGAPIFTGHIRDITERKRAAVALRESQQLLASVTHNVADGIYRRMASGELAFVNQACLRMFGYRSADEIQRVPVDRFYAQEQQRTTLLALLERDGRFTQQEAEFVRQDGNTFWGLVSAIAVRDDASGRILYSDGAITDITARKQAELRRAAQLAVTRVLAEASSLAEATPKILRAVCESLRWDMGAIWHIEGDLLCCVDVWHAGGEHLGEFEQATRATTFARGVGLPGREAVFTVRDHGIGIPEADRAQLFLTFHRGANVGQRPGSGLGLVIVVGQRPGSGLGLVIVKRCVELHGGTLELESKEGDGTTVTVRLPLFSEPAPARKMKPSTSRTSGRSKPHKSAARPRRQPRKP